MSKVWLVSGSARGLGRDIVEVALQGGARVVATARDPQRLDALVARYGDRVRAVALDVTDPIAAKTAVQAALETYGRLDVLVNNAGYGHLAAFEQATEDDFRAQIETNFFGVVNLCRAAVPVMRQQRTGHIIQISSVGGRSAAPGLSAYQAAKWAVGGFSEVLDQELRPLGIKVSVLEPGGMRTDWAATASSHMPPLLDDYQSTFGPLSQLIKKSGGREASDPKKVAQVVVALAAHPKPPLHLLLGSDAYHLATQLDDLRKASDEQWREVSLSTDAQAGPMPSLPEASIIPPTLLELLSSSVAWQAASTS